MIRGRKIIHMFVKTYISFVSLHNLILSRSRLISFKRYVSNHSLNIITRCQDADFFSSYEWHSTIQPCEIQTNYFKQLQNVENYVYVIPTNYVFHNCRMSRSTTLHLSTLSSNNATVSSPATTSSSNNKETWNFPFRPRSALTKIIR